jgi:hypothetical protein
LRALLTALAARGHEVVAIPATRCDPKSMNLAKFACSDPTLPCWALDLPIVRGLPRGSLEQVIFRMDAIHVLADQGVRS